MSINSISGINANGNTAYVQAQQALESAVGEAESAAKQAKAAADNAKLRDACKGFEAMFLNMMYEKMRETVPDNTLWGTSNGEKIMQSMLDSEMTKQMADAGGIGLADLMYNQLSLDNKSRLEYQAHLEAMKNEAGK